MNIRTKKIIIIISIAVFLVSFIALTLYALLVPKHPSTQSSDKTVDKTIIIDNYSKYTSHISPASFDTLGNYLYGFISKPTQGVYHATITDGSYIYSSDSLLSTFTIKLENSDISWNISMHTTTDGDINGDISIICNNSNSTCLSFSDKMNSTPNLQDYLPLSTDNYIIAYQTNSYNTLSIIYYDQAGTGKSNALDKIKSLGFKPEDYTIEYYYGGN